MITPELRQLRYVIEVAEQRSFTRAAERLHVAQQALSQQVRTVEEGLGVRLFERGSRGVEPTAAGLVFVEEARRVVHGAERVVRRTQAAARGIAGSVRLAYTVSSAYETLPQVVARAQDAAPDLRIELREMTAVDLEPALLEGRQDAALCPRMAVDPRIGRLEVRREPFVAALPVGHRLADREAITVAELADEDFQLWPRELTPGYHDAVVAACRDAGFEPRLRDVASGASVWGSIAAGRGVGLVVASLAEQLPPGLTLVPLQQPGPFLIFDLLWSGDHEVPAVALLRDAVVAAASAGGWPRADDRASTAR